MPQDPQNANPGWIGLPQALQMTSADGAGAATGGALTRPGITLPIARRSRRHWRRCCAPPLVTLRSQTCSRRVPPARPMAGGCTGTIGIGVNCAGIFGESFQGMPPPFPF